MPGHAYVHDGWRWVRALLVLLFLLFDLAGLLLLFFPGALTSFQSANLGPQTLLSPTFPANLPSILAAAPSVTTAMRTPTSANGSASTIPGASGTPSPGTQAITSTEGVPGIYVQSIRLDPPTPRRNQPIYFYVTFVNTTGAAQNIRWDILVYRPDNLRQYFGQSLPVGKGDSIAPGSQELRSFGAYKLSGGGGCETVVIRIGRVEVQPVTFVNRPDGSQFLQSIMICP